MRARIVAVMLAVGCFFAPVASAAPCQGVDRSLSKARQRGMAEAIAKYLQVPRVDVLQSFRIGAWSVIYVGTSQADEAFLFFSSDPLKAHHITMWSGAAAKSEEREIVDWALQNAPGIPRRLAACFAWYATAGRNL